MKEISIEESNGMLQVLQSIDTCCRDNIKYSLCWGGQFVITVLSCGKMK